MKKGKNRVCGLWVTIVAVGLNEFRRRERLRPTLNLSCGYWALRLRMGSMLINCASGSGMSWARQDETQADCIHRFRRKHSVPIQCSQGMAGRHRAERRARYKTWRCGVLHLEPMGVRDALYKRWQDADRQQPTQTRYQDFCHWQEELAVQRHCVDGGRSSAVVYSVLLICRACSVDPLAHFRHASANFGSTRLMSTSPICCLSTSPNPPMTDPNTNARQRPRSNGTHQC